MDPTTLLSDIRELVDSLRNDELPDDEAATVGELLAGKVHDLDEWLSRGGFMPTDWTAFGRRQPPQARTDAIADRYVARRR